MLSFISLFYMLNLAGMSSDIITLSEVLDYMDSGRAFDLVHVTADTNRGTGGEIKERNGWKKCDLKDIPEVILLKNKVFKAARDSEDSRTSKKRMIYNSATQEIRPVHIRLICNFNGKRVV